jgi:penicillin amidase
MTIPRLVFRLRMVLDVGAWDESRFSMPGGQSGNPFSPHYDDLLRLWRRGDGVPIVWSEDRIQEAAAATFRLLPEPPSE